MNTNANEAIKVVRGDQAYEKVNNMVITPSEALASPHRDYISDDVVAHLGDHIPLLHESDTDEYEAQLALIEQMHADETEVDVSLFAESMSAMLDRRRETITDLSEEMRRIHELSQQTSLQQLTAYTEDTNRNFRMAERQAAGQAIELREKRSEAAREEIEALQRSFDRLHETIARLDKQIREYDVIDKEVRSLKSEASSLSTALDEQFVIRQGLYDQKAQQEEILKDMQAPEKFQERMQCDHAIEYADKEIVRINREISQLESKFRYTQESLAHRYKYNDIPKREEVVETLAESAGVAPLVPADEIEARLAIIHNQDPTVIHQSSEMSPDLQKEISLQLFLEGIKTLTRTDMVAASLKHSRQVLSTRRDALTEQIQQVTDTNWRNSIIESNQFSELVAGQRDRVSQDFGHILENSTDSLVQRQMAYVEHAANLNLAAQKIDRAQNELLSRKYEYDIHMSALHTVRGQLDEWSKLHGHVSELADSYQASVDKLNTSIQKTRDELNETYNTIYGSSSALREMNGVAEVTERNSAAMPDYISNLGAVASTTALGQITNTTHAAIMYGLEIVRNGAQERIADQGQIMAGLRQAEAGLVELTGQLQADLAETIQKSPAIGMTETQVGTEYLRHMVKAASESVINIRGLEERRQAEAERRRQQAAVHNKPMQRQQIDIDKPMQDTSRAAVVKKFGNKALAYLGFNPVGSNK